MVGAVAIFLLVGEVVAVLDRKVLVVELGVLEVLGVLQTFQADQKGHAAGLVLVVHGSLS